MAKYRCLGTRRERKEKGGRGGREKGKKKGRKGEGGGASGTEVGYSNFIMKNYVNEAFCKSKNASEGDGVVSCIPGGSAETNLAKFDHRWLVA